MSSAALARPQPLNLTDARERPSQVTNASQQSSACNRWMKAAAKVFRDVGQMTNSGEWVT